MIRFLVAVAATLPLAAQVSVLTYQYDASRAGVNANETALTPGSQHVLDVWEQMDTGLMKDTSEAFDEADRRVRERHQAAEGT